MTILVAGFAATESRSAAMAFARWRKVKNHLCRNQRENSWKQRGKYDSYTMHWAFDAENGQLFNQTPVFACQDGMAAGSVQLLPSVNIGRARNRGHYKTPPQL